MSFYTDFGNEFNSDEYAYKSAGKDVSSKRAVALIGLGKNVSAVSKYNKYIRLSDVSMKIDGYNETFVNRLKDNKHNVTFITEKSESDSYAKTNYVRLSVTVKKFAKMASNAMGISLSEAQLVKLEVELRTKHSDVFGRKVACYWRIDNSRVYFDERLIRIVRDVMNEFKMFEITQSIRDVAINAWKKYSSSEIEDPRQTFVRLVGNQINTVLQTPGLAESMMASSEISSAIFGGGITSFELMTQNTNNEPYEVKEELDAYSSKTYKEIAILVHSTSNKEGYVSHRVQGNKHYYNYYPYFTNSDDVLKNTKRISVLFWIGRDKKNGKYKLASHVETRVEGNSVDSYTSLFGRENWYSPDYTPRISVQQGMYFNLSADIDRRFVNAEVFNLFKSPNSIRFGENGILPSNFDGSLLSDSNLSAWVSQYKTLEVYTTSDSKNVELLPIARKYASQEESWNNTEEPDDDDVSDGTDDTEDDGGDVDPSPEEPDDGETDDDNGFTDETFAGYFMNSYFIDDTNLSKFATFLYDKSIWESVLTAIKGDNTDSLISVHVIPVQPSVSDIASESVKMGPFEVSYVKARKITSRYTDKDFGSLAINEYFGDARDYTMTKFRLFLPFFGFVDLDAYDLINSTVSLKCRIDVYTGDGVYFLDVKRGAMSAQLYSYQFNCKLDIPFSSSKKGIGEALTSFGGAMLMSVATENPAPLVLGAVTGAAQAAKVEYRHSSNYNSNVGFMGIMRPYFIINRPVNGEAYSFANFQGIATNKTVVLKNLSGFTKVKEIHLSSSYYTQSEIDEAEALLKEGVIL